MANLDNIMDALEEELKTISSSNGYSTDPTAVYRGFKTFTEVKTFPVLCYSLASELLTEFFGNQGFGEATFTMYGYSQSDNMANNVDHIRLLAHDTVNLLLNDFSYKEDVLEFGNIEYFEGSTDNPSGFMVDVLIKYDFTRETF